MTWPSSRYLMTAALKSSFPMSCRQHQDIRLSALKVAIILLHLRGCSRSHYYKCTAARGEDTIRVGQLFNVSLIS